MNLLKKLSYSKIFEIDYQNPVYIPHWNYFIQNLRLIDWFFNGCLMCICVQKQYIIKHENLVTFSIFISYVTCLVIRLKWILLRREICDCGRHICVQYIYRHWAHNEVKVPWDFWPLFCGLFLSFVFLEDYQFFFCLLYRRNMK